MREIRPSGSEGGAGRKPRSYLYQPATRNPQPAGLLPVLLSGVLLLRAEQKWTELNRAKVDFYTNRPDRPGGSALVRTVR